MSIPLFCPSLYITAFTDLTSTKRGCKSFDFGLKFYLCFGWPFLGLRAHISGGADQFILRATAAPTWCRCRGNLVPIGTDVARHVAVHWHSLMIPDFLPLCCWYVYCEKILGVHIFILITNDFWYPPFIGESCAANWAPPSRIRYPHFFIFSLCSDVFWWVGRCRDSPSGLNLADFTE